VKWQQAPGKTRCARAKRWLTVETDKAEVEIRISRWGGVLARVLAEEGRLWLGVRACHSARGEITRRGENRERRSSGSGPPTPGVECGTDTKRATYRWLPKQP